MDHNTPYKIDLLKTELQQKIDKMVIYLQLKVDCKDWHGVADAAMDIREYEASLGTLKQLDEN